MNLKKARSVSLGLVIGFLAAYGVFVTAAWIKPSSAPLQTARAESVELSVFATAEKVQEAFRAVSAEVLAAVVEVSVKSENLIAPPDGRELPWNDFFQDPLEENEGPRYFQSQGLGSGVIIENRGSDYFVITNAHVVGAAEEIYVELSDGSSIPAQLVGTDDRKDLALLKISSPERPLLVIRLGDSDKLYIGDWVLAFGSPFGYEQSVSSGIVSALGRRDGPGDNINDFIQTDASINQGNSGGALVNIRGELVGINTFITTPNSGSIGLGFAIPLNNIKTTIRQLVDTGEVKYGWLGVSLGAYGEEAALSLGYEFQEGVMIYQVFEESPAYQAGLRAGDLITSLDGKSYSETERLIYRIGDKAPGDTALFEIDRFGEPLVIGPVIGAREEEDAVRALHGSARPGFVAAPLVPDLRVTMNLPEDISGVPVAEVYPRTPAQAVDLRPGDIITSIDGNSITSMKDLYLSLGLSQAEIPEYTVFRSGESIILDTKTGDGP
jgi:serine protease Do